MSIRQLLNGLGRRPVSSKRSRRSLRPEMEGLERREVLTVAFQPVFGAETIDWRSNVGALTNSPLTGPVSNPNVLNNPTVYLIFAGTSWTTATASKYAKDAQTILGSSYLSGLQQYGASGTATYGDFAIDNRVGADTAARDYEIQFVLDLVKPTWQKPPGLRSSTGANVLNSPIYVVVDDNGDGSASNGGGNFFGPNGSSYALNGILIDNGLNEDSFTDLFSHELVERISDGNGVGIGMSAPVSITGENSNAQIADNEPDGRRYTYRLNGSVEVQAYWSVVDQAFIVPDGSQQRVVLSPIWTGKTFDNQFDLLAVANLPSNALPTAAMNAQKTSLSFGGETFAFDAGQIRNVNAYALANPNGLVQVMHYAGPGSSWTPVTGTNTHVSSLVAAGTTLYMRANNGGVSQVWQYGGSGSNWTPVTGTDTAVAQITASGNRVYMLANKGGVTQVWQYSGSGVNWTAITGNNSAVTQIASAGGGLFMLGTAGAVNNNKVQVWQYSGSSNNWTTITGVGTNVSQIVSTGSTLYMLANNGGVNQVWQYNGTGTNWTAVTGTNTSVSQILTVGGRLYMLATLSGAAQVWQYSGSGMNWTPLTGTGLTVTQLEVIGNGLYMVSNSFGVRQVWEYSGQGNVFTPLPSTDPTLNAGP